MKFLFSGIFHARGRWLALAAWLSLLLAGCVVGPDYKKPAAVVPPEGNWKLATPRDQEIKGDWWRLFQDPVLNHLEAQATGSNQLVRVAVARVDQSRAVARIADSPLFPQLTANPSVSTFRTPPDHVPARFSATAFTMPLDFSYEIDLWGKIRRAYESAQAQTEASVADYYNVLLTLHGDVAVNYFLLRQMDAQLALLEETLALRRKSVQLLEERFHAELTSALDQDRARAELAQTQTLVTETRRQRANLQDALALLCGQSATAFQIAAAPPVAALPAIPLRLPSRLLERRPDVAEAERKMAAANAEIGVAKAAYFPAISLTGEAGYSSFNAGTLLDWESRLFQIGPQMALPILNGGRITSGLKEARANYQAVCAGYQQQVLLAFKDVSDALADADSYRQQAVSEAGAVAFASQAVELSKQRYDQGLVSYLEVLDAERTQLQDQIQATQIAALQMTATVHLIKALGGGFSARD